MLTSSRTIALLVGWTVLLSLAACGGGGSSSSPTAPPTPTPPQGSTGSATFQIQGTGGNLSLSYATPANTVLCTRNAGWASLFIRFAEQSTGNGQNGARLDLDLCNHSGGGFFSPKDPTVAACGGNKTFDVFWHAANGATFSNNPSAGNCTLMITEQGNQLTGTFNCDDLPAIQGGTGMVAVMAGSFTCNIV